MVALENNNGTIHCIYWTKQNYSWLILDYIYAIVSMWEENKCFINTLPLIYQYPSFECRIGARIHFVPECKCAQIFALGRGFNLTLTLHILLMLVIITKQKWELVFSVMDVKQNPHKISFKRRMFLNKRGTSWNSWEKLSNIAWCL